MMKTLVFVICSFLIPAYSFSQITLSSPDNKNVLNIGGLFSAYYNYRLPVTGYVNNKHDEFGLRDMVVDFYGKAYKDFSYELKVDFANLISDAVSGGTISPDNPGLRSAYVQYNGLPVHVKIGWDKVPYSQGSLTDIFESPYWSRDLLTSGDMFSRRDMGLTLSTALANEQVNIYAGAYSGIGEYFLLNGDNDASGQPEYIGRVDFSFPKKYDYKSVDLEGSKVFKFRIGANGRYTNKTQPGNYTISSKILGDYDLNIVDGKKSIYGFDFSAEYNHFSFQAEYDKITLKPVDPTNTLFHGTTSAFNGGKVNAGGWVGTVNYFWKTANSVISAKFDEENLNDLVAGKQENLHIGYAYLVNGWHSCLKAEWIRPLKQDYNSDPINYTNNFRIGLQVLFDNENFSR